MYLLFSSHLKMLLTSFFSLLPFFVVRAYELCKGPQRGQRFMMMEKEFLCASACKKAPDCSSYLYKDRQEFQDDEPNNEFDGNCVLRNKYEDYLLSELQELGNGYKAKLGLVVDDTGTIHFHKMPTDYNVTEEAIAAGYTTPMEIPSLKTTRFVKHHTYPSAYIYGQGGYNLHHWVCPLLGGILVPEYDMEVTQALTDIGGSTPTRALAMTRSPTATGAITLWETGMQDWANDLDPSECPRYSAWTADDWTGSIDGQEQKVFLDTTSGTFIQGGVFPYVTQVSCQFIGKNLAFEKPTGALHHDWPAHSHPHAVDGRYNTMYHGKVAAMDHWYVNLLDQYAIKLITLGTRGGCCSERNFGLDFWVGNEAPKGTFDETKFRLCTHFEHKQYVYDVHGFTCDHWTIGQFLVIKNRVHTEAIQLNEVTVHGWPISIFK